MNLVYLDTGLGNNLGHHANFCRHIVNEMRSRNVPTAVFGRSDVVESLRAELGVVPWFRCWTYARYDADPVCGWLMDFELVARVICEDIQSIAGIGPDDLVYMNSVQPAQFMGIVRWLKSVAEDRRPKVIVEFGTDPGLTAVATPGGTIFQTRDPRLDARATLHRYAARHVTETDLRRLRLVTFDERVSAIFQTLLEVPVATVPMPFQALTSRRDRTGKRPITVSLLGHQRLEKGYALVPELAARLLRSRSDIRLLIHNSAPRDLASIQDSLRAIAAADDRLCLNEQTVDATEWAHLLDQTDLMICPYMINRFATSHSGVVSEAMANGIPLVAPAGTTLAALMAELGNSGVVFGEETVDSVFSATESALDRFDELAGSAKEASARWEQTRGANLLADAMLSWRGGA